MEHGVTEIPVSIKFLPAVVAIGGVFYPRRSTFDAIKQADSSLGGIQNLQLLAEPGESFKV